MGTTPNSGLRVALPLSRVWETFPILCCFRMAQIKPRRLKYQTSHRERKPKKTFHFSSLTAIRHNYSTPSISVASQSGFLSHLQWVQFQVFHICMCCSSLTQTKTHWSKKIKLRLFDTRCGPWQWSLEVWVTRAHIKINKSWPCRHAYGSCHFPKYIQKDKYKDSQIKFN